MTTFTLIGKIPSKKNKYNIRRTKGGGHTLYKDASLQSELDAIAFQIPPGLKGKVYRHPAMTFKFDVPKPSLSSDRDGKYTALLDILVKAKVIHDDCIRHCNGKHTILESEITDEHTTTVTIEPNETADDDRGGKPTVSAKPKRLRK